jgi:uncharacterized damage-inducible protein DinB
LVGVILINYPRYILPSASQEAFILWHTISGSIAFMGFIQIFRAGSANEKSVEERRHQELLQQIKQLREEIQDFKQQVTNNTTRGKQNYTASLTSTVDPID